MHGPPASQVGPSKLCRHYQHLLGLLQNSVVNGLVGALPINGLNKLGFAVAAKMLPSRIKHGIHFGHVLFKSTEDGVGVPNKNPCVPQKFARSNELLGHFEIGLLGEGLDGMHVFGKFRPFRPKLNVPVARFGADWGHSQSHQHIVLGRCRQSRIQPSAKLRLVAHKVVSRGNYKIG